MAKTPLEAVYYYRAAPTAHEEALRRACAVQGVRFRTLAPEDAGQTVGALVGLPGFVRGEAEATSAPDEEMLLLHRFADRGIDRFLAALRRAEVPKIALKAIVTEHNVSWTLAALAEELRREHAEFAAMRQKKETES